MDSCEDGGSRLCHSTWCRLAIAKVAQSSVNDNKRVINNKGTANVILLLEMCFIVIKGR